MALKTVLIVVVLLACVQIEITRAIKINLFPTRFTGEKEENVKVGCKLDEAEASAKEIMVLKIAKKGEKALIIIHPNNTISYVNGKKEDFSAEGKIDDPVSKSYLRMTIKKPDVDDTGSYTCNIYYMDESGTLVEDKASAYLTVDDPEVKNFKVDIKTLKERIEKLVLKLKRVGAPNPLIAFSATNQQFIKPYTGKQLIFPDIITQVGAGYTPHNGVFRAPVGGLYSFSLMLKTGCITCYVRVQLLANDKILFRLKVGTYHDENQGFASAAVQLREGDKVYPYVDFADKGATINPNRLSIFEGHLINKYNKV